MELTVMTKTAEEKLQDKIQTLRKLEDIVSVNWGQDAVIARVLGNDQYDYIKEALRKV